MTQVEEALASAEDRPAVFLLWARAGKPYLARTNVLRRRLNRLAKLLTIHETIERVEYSYVGSKLESQMLVLDLARKHLGSDYRKQIRLRFPPYVKVLLENEYPRTHITPRLGRLQGVWFGPFRNRATAAHFESEFLDLFQMRRCQEELRPNPEHPGCIYGEMGKCLRPCQVAVGPEEYAAETRRVTEFLSTSGRSLLSPALAERSRLSEAMDFEGAAAMHKRVERIEEIVGLMDEMARDVSRLHSVCVLPSSADNSVELAWLRNGCWLGMTRFNLDAVEGRPASMDARLREAAQSATPIACAPREQMERLAVVARWFYSSWRDGEMLVIDDWEKLPLRKMVNAVARVAASQRKAHPDNHSA